MRRRAKPSASARTRRPSLGSFTSRRSPPAKGGRSPPGRRPRSGPPAPTSGYKLADAAAVERAALAVLRAHRGDVSTQGRLWEEVAERLWKEDPPMRVGPERMRALLATSQRLKLEVRYANRPMHGPLLSCPVCRHPVVPRHNATLWGDTVIVGYRCTVCPFWTPIKRRVPARYAFRVLPWGMGKLSA